MSESTAQKGASRPNHLWRSRAQRAGQPFRHWKEITAEVADRHGLSWSEILSRSHARRVAWPRQEAWALIWAQGHLSLPAIGRRFDRHHTTILHGATAHEKRQAEAAVRAARAG